MNKRISAYLSILQKYFDMEVSNPFLAIYLLDAESIFGLEEDFEICSKLSDFHLKTLSLIPMIKELDYPEELRILTKLSSDLETIHTDILNETD